MPELNIGGKIINEESDAFVIAEIGHNHQGDLKKCMDMFVEAKNCGCDAVKLQKRDNRTLFTADLFNSPYENENSFGRTYGEHREALEFSSYEYLLLSQKAKLLGLTFFATAFDIESADFLEMVEIPCYKIASGCADDFPLLKYIAEFGKPMLISTGGVSWNIILKIIDEIVPINPQISFLHCTAAYPIRDWTEVNLNMIPKLRDLGFIAGFSDHSVGIAMPISAYVLGARIIEKHFTFNRTAKGTDHAWSLEPQGMKRMVRDLRRLKQALGDGVKRTYESESKPLYKMGKGLYFSRDLPKGHKLNNGDICIKSPKTNVSPIHYDYFQGKILDQDVKKEQSIIWEIVKDENQYE